LEFLFKLRSQCKQYHNIITCFRSRKIDISHRKYSSLMIYNTCDWGLLIDGVHTLDGVCRSFKTIEDLSRPSKNVDLRRKPSIRRLLTNRRSRNYAWLTYYDMWKMTNRLKMKFNLYVKLFSKTILSRFPKYAIIISIFKHLISWPRLRYWERYDCS
jgi:hypothetical protein